MPWFVEYIPWLSCITLSYSPSLYVACANLCSCCSQRLASCTMLKLATNIKAMPSIYLCTHITESAVHGCIGGIISAIFNLVDVKENQPSCQQCNIFYVPNACSDNSGSNHAVDCLWFPLIQSLFVEILFYFACSTVWLCSLGLDSID